MDRELLHLNGEAAAAYTPMRKGQDDLADQTDASFDLGVILGADAGFRTALNLAFLEPEFARKLFNDVEAYIECLKVALEGFDVPAGQIETIIKTEK